MIHAKKVYKAIFNASLSKHVKAKFETSRKPEWKKIMKENLEHNTQFQLCK